MLLTTLLLVASPAHPAAHAPAQDRRAEVTARYQELAAAGDREGLAELWSANVGLVLQTIDADLEGSLSLWEAAPEEPPVDEIDALHTRALFGASVAAEALGRPLLLDYATSFVGWTDPQKHAFRAGQAVFGRAAQELREGDKEVAFAAGLETVERAMALGDWWGAAMGYGVRGEAARAQGWHEDALSNLSMARALNHALGLEFSEYRNLRGMLGAARALERHPRALAIARELARAAEGFGDAEGLREALAAQAELEEALGHAEAAQATRSRLEALPAPAAPADGE
jgi:hypothetical protein